MMTDVRKTPAPKIDTLDGRQQTVGRAVAELRSAHRALRELGVGKRAELIHDVGQAWTRVDTVPVADWLAVSAEPAGYTAPMLRWGCRETFGRWSRPELYCLVGDELGQPERVDQIDMPEVVFVVLASTVPPAGLQSIMLTLLAGSAVIVRSARSLRPLIGHFLSSLTTLSPQLAAAIRLVDVDPTDMDGMAALARDVDAVVVHGSDEAVHAWRTVTPPSTRLVGYGHRISAAALGKDLGRDPQTLRDTLDGLALDLCAWDQSGCLSPHVLYVERGGPWSVHELAEQLVDVALPEVESRLPAAPLSVAERARRESYVRSMLLEAECHSTLAGATILACDQPGPLVPGPGMRVLTVRPVDDLDALVECLSTASPKLQALGVAGVPDVDALAARLEPAGLNLVCAPGHMQRPPLHWNHDGVGNIAPLVGARRPRPDELDTVPIEL